MTSKPTTKLALLISTLLVGALVWTVFFTDTPAPNIPQGQQTSLADGTGDIHGSQSVEGASVSRSPTDPAATTGRPDQQGGRFLQVTGRVTDASNNPVHGATIVIGDKQKLIQASPTWTGKDGAFTAAVDLTRSRSKVLPVGVRASMFAPFQTEIDLNPKDKMLDVGTLTLSKGGRVIGRVVDADGVGIANASVELHPTETNKLAWCQDREELFALISTGPLGHFAFEQVLASNYRFKAYAEAYTSDERSLFTVQADQTHDLGEIRLHPGCTLSGTVFAADGRLVENATVSVHSTNNSSSQPWSNKRCSTDSQGRYELKHLPLTTFRMQVRAKGYLTWQSDGLDTEVERERDVHLEAGFQVSGVVIDKESGRPIERFAIMLRRIGVRHTRKPGQDPFPQDPLKNRNRFSQYQSIPRQIGAQEQHPNGEFSLTGIEAGIYIVYIAADDFLRRASETFEVERQAPHQQLRIALERGLRLHGQVCNSKGEGVAGAIVTLRTQQALVEQTETNRSGAFKFDHCPRGEFTLTAKHGDSATTSSAPFELTTGDREVNLEMADFAGLQGRVLDMQQSKDETVSVVAIMPANTSIGRQTTQVKADGSYRFEDLQPGDYRVRAFIGPVHDYVVLRRHELYSHPNRAYTSPSDVTLLPGQISSYDPKLDIPALGSLEGNAQHNGRPGEGMAIRWSKINSPIWRSTFQTVRSDTQGNFKIENLAVGSYEISISHRKSPHSTIFSSTFEIARDATTRRQFAIQTGGLRGRVLSSISPEKLQGMLTVYPGYSSKPATGDHRTHAISIVTRIATGRFKAEHIPSGPAWIEMKIRNLPSQGFAVQIPSQGMIERNLPLSKD